MTPQEQIKVCDWQGGTYAKNHGEASNHCRCEAEPIDLTAGRPPQTKNGRKFNIICGYGGLYADMAELADALASGASWGNSVQVRFLLSAEKQKSCLWAGFLFFVDFPRKHKTLDNHII